MPCHATLLRRNFAKQPWMWPTRLASEWIPALLPLGQMVAPVFFFFFFIFWTISDVESNRIRWYIRRNLGLIIGAASTIGLYIRILDSNFFSLIKWKELPCGRWRVGGWLLSIEKLQLIGLFVGIVFYTDSLTEPDPWYSISWSRRKRLRPKATISLGSIRSLPIRFSQMHPNIIQMFRVAHSQDRLYGTTHWCQTLSGPPHRLMTTLIY